MENTKNEEKCAISDVMFCTFCGKEINPIELSYTEDAEPSHIKCLVNKIKYWEDKREDMDLMGY